MKTSVKYWHVKLFVIATALIVFVVMLISLSSCATFDAKDFTVLNRDGKIKIKVVDSYNQAPIEGTSADVLLQRGTLKGAGKLLSGEISGGTGGVEIIIENTGNIGFKGY